MSKNRDRGQEASSLALVARRRHEKNRREEEREREWSHESFFKDLHKASQLLTSEIEGDPAEAEALDRARQQAHEGKLVSQEELDQELGTDDE